jgi:hypothetical protein
MSRRSLGTAVPHPMRPQPSPASGRLASRRTGTAQGQLLHPWGASPRRYGPTAHRLPVQAMEISSHDIIVPRGAQRKYSHTAWRMISDGNRWFL